MTIRWTPTGLRDLQAMRDYISEDRPEAAVAMVERILSGPETLKRFPDMGRKGRVEGTRELVMSPYVIAYRVKRESIEVIAIIHGARRWPDSF
jgi:toxin ParE1/3/4